MAEEDGTTGTNGTGIGEPAAEPAAGGVTLEEVMGRLNTLQESNTKLEKNNAELRGQLTNAREKARAFGDADPNDILEKANAYDQAKREEEEATLSAAETAKRAKDQISTLETRIAEMQTQHKEEKRKLVIDRNLTDALVAANITNEFGLRGAEKVLYDRIIVDPDTNEPMVGGLPLKDYVKQWATTDPEGLWYAEGSGAGGSGQRGGRQQNAVSDERERLFDPGDPPGSNPHYNETRQIEVYRADPTLYNAWKKKYESKGIPIGMGPTVMPS